MGSLYARCNMGCLPINGFRDLPLFWYRRERHVNTAEVLVVQILSVPNEVRRRLKRPDIANRLEQMAEIPNGQICSGLQNHVRGSNATAPPGSFETSLKTPHADHEIVDLHMTSLIQVSQNLGDLPSDSLLVISLRDHTVGLSRRQLGIARTGEFSAWPEHTLASPHIPMCGHRSQPLDAGIPVRRVRPPGSDVDPPGDCLVDARLLLLLQAARDQLLLWRGCSAGGAGRRGRGGGRWRPVQRVAESADVERAQPRFSNGRIVRLPPTPP